MGASIKQHLVEGMRNMWQQLNEFARSHTSGTAPQGNIDGGDNYGNLAHIIYIYIFIAALIFLLEYFRITRAFCILPYCTVYIVRSL